MTTEIFHQINKERINKNLKVVDLCRLSGLSNEAWLRVKHNRNYTFNVLAKFCKVLDIKEVLIKFE